MKHSPQPPSRLHAGARAAASPGPSLQPDATRVGGQ
jgi:hypothetical protein